MLLAVLNIDGKETTNLYNSVQDYIKDTFNPEIETVTTLNFSLGKKAMLTAKTYKSEYERKKSFLQYLAVEWSYISGWAYGLSWYEYAKIQEWFYINGKRYGLLKEFQENCIC